MATGKIVHGVGAGGAESVLNSYHYHYLPSRMSMICYEYASIIDDMFLVILQDMGQGGHRLRTMMSELASQSDYRNVEFVIVDMEKAGVSMSALSITTAHISSVTISSIHWHENQHNPLLNYLLQMKSTAHQCVKVPYMPTKPRVLCRISHAN